MTTEKSSSATTTTTTATAKSVTWSLSASASIPECMDDRGVIRDNCEDERSSRSDDDDDKEELQDEQQWSQHVLEEDGGYDRSSSNRRTNFTASHPPTGGESNRSRSQKIPRNGRRRPPRPRRKTKRRASLYRRLDDQCDDDDDRSDDGEDDCYDENTRQLHQRVAEEMEHALFGGDDDDEEVDDENFGRNTAIAPTGTTPRRSVGGGNTTLHLSPVLRDFTLFGDDGGTNDGAVVVHSSSLSDRCFRMKMRKRSTANVPKHASGRAATAPLAATGRKDGLIYSQRTYLEFLGVAERMMMAPTHRQLMYVQYIAMILCLLFFLHVVCRIVASTIGSSIILTVAVWWTGQEVWDTLSGYSHPLKWIRWVHSSPVQYLTTVGATIGLLQSMWRNIVQPTIIDTLHDLLHTFQPTNATPAATATTMTDDQEGTMLIFNADYFFQQYSRNMNSVDDWCGRSFVLWVGTAHGLLWGLLVGIGWRYVFGHTEKATPVSKYLHRHIWKLLKRHYRIASLSVAASRSNTAVSGDSRRTTTTPSTADSGEENTDNPTPSTTDLPTPRFAAQEDKNSTQPDPCQLLFLSSVNSNSCPGTGQSEPKKKTLAGESCSEVSKRCNEKTKCAICLEQFVNIDDDNPNIDQPRSPLNAATFMLYDMIGNDQNNEIYKNDRSDMTTTSNQANLHVSEGDRYQLRPCCHYFHRDCACEWLTINKSCPVCRVPVQAILGCT